ncbi:IS110 family RNA-guided transposase [Roseicella aerolata]|uniref:IS110 family transposase n=1 Tax=Roseicella aerolata TaxID=2883479 RepID=A0A9X1ILD3_9PROT|nr:IS110 family transposase [Roseicella aerolata]MCB4825230.1 IS110 family transposase [Roseicella aerolata]
MSAITTVGLDLAKNVFQVHGIDASGQVVLRRKLRRSEVEPFFKALPPALVGMEACGGAHFWARELMRLGHSVRLMPPSYVKPYVKRGKTDAADAEAICEAVTRPTMRFVPVKDVAHQAAALELKTRELLVRQRSQAISALRAHMSEYGIIAARGIPRLADLTAVIRDIDDRRLPDMAREVLLELVEQIESMHERIERLDRRMVRRMREDETARRLATVPGIGAVIATALQALVPDPKSFASARHFAAWLGLAPRSHSSGGKERLGGISKQGNPVLRRLLVLGATAQLKHVQRREPSGDWMGKLLERRPFKVAAVVVANKMARIAWALLAKGGTFRASVVTA